MNIMNKDTSKILKKVNVAINNDGTFIMENMGNDSLFKIMCEMGLNSRFCVRLDNPSSKFYYNDIIRYYSAKKYSSDSLEGLIKIWNDNNDDGDILFYIPSESGSIVEFSDERYVMRFIPHRDVK